MYNLIYDPNQHSSSLGFWKKTFILNMSCMYSKAKYFNTNEYKILQVVPVFIVNTEGYKDSAFRRTKRCLVLTWTAQHFVYEFVMLCKLTRHELGWRPT